MLKQKKIRVLIVDDSASVRQTLQEIISDDPELEVMATAADPYIAAERIAHEIPDVVLLDIEMPRMDGLTFLRKIMSQRPMPVIMCSSLTEESSPLLLSALDAGAVDVLAKPRVDTKQYLMESRVHICDAIRAAAGAKLKRQRPEFRPVEAKLSADVMLKAPPPGPTVAETTEPLVCIGASTGGTESLRAVLEALPARCPGIVIVQHMPETFTNAFARRLDSLCRMDVCEAKDGDRVMPGRVLIAPGNRHLLLQRRGSQYHVIVRDGPLVSRHRPSVDVLFRSAARAAGANATGILMTGMGDDGAHGLLEMKRAGAQTIAQDEESCVVFGMPKEAIALGAADRVVPLSAIPGEIMRVHHVN